MRVINLMCKNHGAIEALEVPVQGGSYIASGKTGTGKTTAISILWDLIEKNPKIRKGEKTEELEAYIETPQGGFLVCKRINVENGSSKITIIDEAGESKPAAYAKSLLSEISKNPLALFEKTGNERFDFLLKCSTIDQSEYQALKISRQLMQSERLQQRQLAESLRLKLGVTPVKVEPIDFSQKQQELQNTYLFNSQVDKSISALYFLKKDIVVFDDSIKQIELKIENLKKEITEKEKLLKEEIEKKQSVNLRIVNAEIWLSENPKKSTEKAEAELSQAVKTNEAVQVYENWIEKRKSYEIENKKWIYLDEKVKTIDDDIKNLLSKMEFPIDGLTVENNSIMYNGVDYDALGTSDQILISAALTAQSIVNCKEVIHAIRIDRGESMDEETQQKVIDICSKIGVQVFISVVDRSSKNETLIIDII